MSVRILIAVFIKETGDAVHRFEYTYHVATLHSTGISSVIKLKSGCQRIVLGDLKLPVRGWSNRRSEAHSLSAPQSVKWLGNVVIPCNIRIGWSHILLEAVHLWHLFFNVKDDYMELQKKNKGENNLFLTNSWSLFILGDAKWILCLCWNKIVLTEIDYDCVTLSSDICCRLFMWCRK